MKNIIIGILIIVLIFSMQKCTDNKSETDSVITELNADVSFFKNKLGTITASKTVLEVSNKNLKKIMSDTLKKLAKEFSKVKSIIEVRSKIQIDSIPVYFETQIPCVFERHGLYPDKHFNFNWKFNQEGFNLEDIQIPNEQYTITGFKRKWFLGRTTLTVDITNTNPYIKITNIESTLVKVPIRFIDTRVFNIGIGFLGAAILFR